MPYVVLLKTLFVGMIDLVRRVLTALGLGGAQQPTALQQFIMPQIETTAAITARTAKIASHATAKACNRQKIVSKMQKNTFSYCSKKCNNITIEPLNIIDHAV